MNKSRPHDPFAPHRPTTGSGHPVAMDEVAEPESGPTTPSGVSSANTSVPDDAPPGDELGLLRRVELVRIAEREGIASYGTRDALIARIRSRRADR